MENGVPKVLTMRVQVIENKTEVMTKELRGNNDNNYHDKTEVLDGKKYERNNENKKHINEETIGDPLDKIDAVEEYQDIIEEKEIEVAV